MKRPLVVATRSAHKLREIRAILGELPEWELMDLNEAGIAASPDEEGIEAFDTFHENALAKARYFAAKTGGATLADDSGLCVDALDGAPGVHSKRFSRRTDLAGDALDAANNALLLKRLAEVPSPERTAHYRCALVMVDEAGEVHSAGGRCDGVILTEPRGNGGFGYDPLFFLPAENATFGELPSERKNEISHRARALRGARRFLEGAASPRR